MTAMLKANYRRLGLVLLSLILALGHFGPLRGSLFALLLTVGAQVYLFGWLLARALGLLREAESGVLRLIWIVVCGLSISITLGAAARLLLVPVGAAVVLLHGVMLVLAVVPASSAPPLRFDRRRVPQYLLLAVACAVFVLVGWQLNHVWSDGYEDQSLPVSLADWWANHTPENLVTRHIAETNTLTYWSSDGLTYVFAAWVWSSGCTAVQLIWYVLTPLFAWLVPLAHYALVYRVTQRADTAAWATGIVLILALTTINSNMIYSGAWMFGQEAAFQLDTLRTFSTALLMPLVLFAFFTSLRAPSLRHDLLTGVTLFALALTHPRQFLALLTGLYAILALSWLLRPSRARLRRTVLLGVVLLPALGVPAWQYTANLRAALRPTILTELSATVTSTQTIIEPSGLLFQPLVTLALILSAAAILRLRRSLAAQYIVATILVLLVVAYVPPVFNSVLRIFGSYFGLHYVLELFYIVPFGLILAVAIAFLHDQLTQRLHFRVFGSNWSIALIFAAAAGLLLFEPFPLPLTARDQLAEAADDQAIRDIRPFDALLLERLRTLPVTGDKVVYLTANRISNYIIESVPNAFLVGGRPETNAAYDGATRFFEASDAPWLDAADVAFLQTYPVDYLVVSADNTRVPQLLLQPERFIWVDTVAGYLIFRPGAIGAVSADDQLFARMNALYATDPQPRWAADGFHLERPANADLWQPLVVAWQARLALDPADEPARYGLAVAALLAGDDQPARWADLSAAHPGIAFLAAAQARLLAEQGQAQVGADLLVTRLAEPALGGGVLAARELLSETFFRFLTPAQLDAALALEDSDAATWAQLMEWTGANALRPTAALLGANADHIRQRAALLLTVDRRETAARWLSRIPALETSPGDLVARAGLLLVSNQVDAARALLRPATDSDWIRPRFNLHRERWTETPNAAARLLAALDATDSDLTPRLLAATGQLFAMQPEITQQGARLQVSVVLGNFAPALAPRRLTIRVGSTDGATVYGQTEYAYDLPLGTLERVTIAVELPPDLPGGTPAQVVIEPQYSAAVTYPPLVVAAELSGGQPVAAP